MRARAISLLVMSLWGCDAEGDRPAPSTRPSDTKVAAGTSAAAPVIAAGSSSAAASAPQFSVEEDAKLRRKYGVAEMKYNACAKVQGTTVQGRGCPATILVYGPYANVPANSEVELTFDIQGTTAITVYSDMFAQVGKRPLGALVPQAIPAGEKRHLGYRVNLATADTAMEARIWLHGTGPADFDITNLALTVR